MIEGKGKMDREIDIRLMKARMNVRVRQPFLGAVALSMHIVEEPGIVTMCTDGTNMFYDPTFLDKVTEAELTGVVAEEAYHKANKHHLRRGPREPELWNIACDYQIHNDLLLDGFKFPKAIEINGEMVPIYHDPQYAGLSAEDIYYLLEKKREEEKQNAEASDEQGDEGEERDSTSGMGGEGEDEETEEDQDETEEDTEHDGSDPDGNTESEDEVSDDADTDGSEGTSVSAYGQPSEGSEGHEAAEAKAQKIAAEILKGNKLSGVGMIIDAPDKNSEIETEITLQECISVAKRAGTLPGYLQRLVKELNEPKTDWRTELRRFISPSYRKDSTWARPNRRHLHSGMYLPGFVSDGVSSLVLVVDGSGSIDYEALKQVISEVQSVLDIGGVDKVHVIYCDMHVYNEREYVAGEQIEILPAQSGGTMFAPAFRWIAENAPEAAGVVYFTDMFAADWKAMEALRDDSLAPPTLWAAHGDPRQYRNIVAPFGDTIEVNY